MRILGHPQVLQCKKPCQSRTVSSNLILLAACLLLLQPLQVRTYSGGMKRRLSVAISFVGDPRVVFLDEPSTGLDPASRRSLWDVVTRSKAGRGVLLTTHSMEEAQVIDEVLLSMLCC